VGTPLYPDIFSEVPMGVPLNLDNYQEVPAREPLYPKLIDIPSRPIRISSISSSGSEKNFYDAIDPIVDLEKAKIRAIGAQRAVAKATAAREAAEREAAEAYVIYRKQAMDNFTECAQASIFCTPEDWAESRAAKERLANANQAVPIRQPFNNQSKKVKDKMTNTLSFRKV
jgi:hypothetical protein